MNWTFESDKLGTLIYHHFRTRENLAKALGVSRGSIQRWYTHDPKKFLYYTPELMRMGVSQNELVESVTQRESFVKASV